MILFSLVTLQGKIKPLLAAATSYALNITIYGPPRDDFRPIKKLLKSGLSFDAWYIIIHIISLAMEVTLSYIYVEMNVVATWAVRVMCMVDKIKVLRYGVSWQI